MMTKEQIAELKKQAKETQGSGYFIAKAEDKILDLISHIEETEKAPKSEMPAKTPKVVTAPPVTASVRMKDAPKDEEPAAAAASSEPATSTDADAPKAEEPAAAASEPAPETKAEEKADKSKKSKKDQKDQP